MKIIVDGLEDLVQVDPDESGTLLDFFNTFKEFLSSNDKILSSITIDGYEMTPPFVDDIFEKNIAEINLISVETIPVRALCLQTLEEVEVHIKLSFIEFKKASDIIYSQKFEEASDLISRATQKLRFCQQALDSVMTILVNRKVGIDKAHIRQKYKELEEVITQLSESLQNNDFMMVKDVIDYELLDKMQDYLNLKVELNAKLLAEF